LLISYFKAQVLKRFPDQHQQSYENKLDDAHHEEGGEANLETLESFYRDRNQDCKNSPQSETRLFYILFQLVFRHDVFPFSADSPI
jgi:hypothetical protein